MDWAPDRKMAFKKLKGELANATLLVFPDPSAQFAVQTDASGSVLELYCNKSMVKVGDH